MPFTTVVSGTTITAAWGNQVRDQSVTPFATAAARTSAITSPVEGMLTYRSDAKVIETYDGSAWRPAAVPAMVAGVRVTNAGNPIATTSGTTEMDLAKLQLTGLTLVTGRYYIVTYQVTFTKTVAGDSFEIRLRANTAVSGTQIGQQGAAATESLTVGQRDWSIIFVGDSSYTSLYVSAVRTSGTGTFSYFGTTGGFVRSYAKLLDCGVTAWTDVA